MDSRKQATIPTSNGTINTNLAAAAAARPDYQSMPAPHGHGHGHAHGAGGKANCYTNINTVFTFAALAVGLTFDFAVLIDDWAGIEEKPVFGHFSWGALSGGVAVGLFSAIGSTYCHRILNTNHQNESPLAISYAPDLEKAEEKKAAPDDAAVLLPSVEYTVSSWQRVALLGDRLSHVNEVATIFMGVIEALSEYYGLTRWEQAGLDLVPLFMGYLSSIADVTTCKHSLVLYNKKTAEEKEEEVQAPVGTRLSLNSSH